MSVSVARVYACFEAATWTSLSKCEVLVQADGQVVASRARDGVRILFGRPCPLPEPELNDTQHDGDGKPCYVVAWFNGDAFGRPDLDPQRRVGAAFRFYSGAEAADAFAAIASSAAALAGGGPRADGSYAPGGAAGTDGEEQEEAEDEEADEEVDVDVTSLLRLSATLLRREEDISGRGVGSGTADAASASRGQAAAATASAAAAAPVGGSAGGAILDGWVSAGSGVVQLVRVTHRRQDPEWWSSGDESAREWEAAARGEAVPSPPSAQPGPVPGAAPSLIELVMQLDEPDAGGPRANSDMSVVRSGGGEGWEGGVSAGAAAALADPRLASALLLEAVDERLGSEDDMDVVPFMLSFDSPVDAARFRLAYERAQALVADDAGGDALGEAGGADAGTEWEGEEPGEHGAGRGAGLSEEEAMAVHEQLFRSLPFAVVRALSAEERQRRGLVTAQLAYSEARFDGMAGLISVMRDELALTALKRGGGKFVDLGSGVGKALMAAALLHSFDECVGIELLRPLHEAAVAMLDKFDRTARQALPASRRRVAVQLVRDDLARIPWLDADVVLCISTTFDATLMSRIAAISNDMSVGAVFVTTTTRLPSARWAVRQRYEFDLAHGSVTAFVHEKVMP
ncbi:hypothetical protein FNF28_04426 [Cafeteria roenbergensis]|uniref:Histone-lysine N-methyltransferase, H3 lysine-79 specific n=1 Tax=Cafeteria roenbergensis TaxID=33653 RepID=A0A5A8DC95_CAFRO|nr:hypothetical protein FNF28_04426 [Cafeteria roenbergensis]